MNENLYPIIPLKEIVIFPNMVIPLMIAKKSSIFALKNTDKKNTIFFSLQKKSIKNIYKLTNIHRIGVIAKIIQLIRLQDNSVKILVKGIKKAKVIKLIKKPTSTKVEVNIINDKFENYDEAIAMKKNIILLLEKYLKYNNNKKIEETIENIKDFHEINEFVDSLCSVMNLAVENRQKILSEKNINQILEILMIYLNTEVELLKTEKKIKSRLQEQIGKNQKEYYLQEQLKAIKKELGEKDLHQELKEIEKKTNNAILNKKIRSIILKEIKKLQNLNLNSSEATIVKNYIDLVISLPWRKATISNYNLKKAKYILSKKHYSLNKVKERVIEFLALQIKSKKIESNIICFIGPPGTGKTSFVKSISNATQRNFAKITLGGLSDEAEIKGHRRTYIGAMPGKIIQTMKNIKTINPLILLDEIDKIGKDYRGDPSSALLEVLDKTQNKHFNDNYLEIDFNLSNIMFIATANEVNIPKALLDRLEMIEISGYTIEEKLNISINHIIPKIRNLYLISKDEIKINKKSILNIIRFYTREAGIRNLTREIEKLFRKAVKHLLIKNKKNINISNNRLISILGIKQFNKIKIRNGAKIGVVNGLAYTEGGGEIIEIEANKYLGKGNIKITGQIGNIMKESIQISYSYIYSKIKRFNIKEEIIKKNDIHIHIPEGSISKDGPSAGIAITTSIISTLTEIPIKQNAAITGEITLQGSIIAIGGIKEKLLTAIKNRIKTIIIPKDNIKNIGIISKEVKKRVKVKSITNFQEVLRYVFINHNLYK